MKQENNKYQNLVNLAKEAQKNAYAPYSKYKVGAAVLCKTGKIFTGCNVENASYGLTNCAERTAIFKAVSEGYKDFEAIAIITPKERYAKPCGACRQVMAEFMTDEADIILANKGADFIVKKLKDIFPDAFRLL